MEILAAGGDRAGALKRYRALQDLLQRELGAEPDPTTRALADSLLQRKNSGTSEPGANTTARNGDTRREGVDAFAAVNLQIEPARVQDAELADLADELRRETNRCLVSTRRGRVVLNAAEAEFIASGRLTRRGDGLRVALEIANRAGKLIWSERFEEASSEPDHQVETLANRIAFAISIANLPGSPRPDAMAAGDEQFRLGLIAFNKATPTAMREAIERLGEALRQRPDGGDIEAMLGWAHFVVAVYAWDHDIESHWAAVDELSRKAVAKSPDLPFPLTLAAANATRLGELDAALAYANRAVELHPNWPVSWRARGWANAARGDLGAALNDAETALTVGPRGPWAFQEHWQYATYLYRLGRQYEALVQANLCNVAKPGFHMAKFLLAWILHALNRHEEAARAVRELTRIAPDYSADSHRLASFFSSPEQIDREIAILGELGWHGAHEGDNDGSTNGAETADAVATQDPDVADNSSQQNASSPSNPRKTRIVFRGLDHIGASDDTALLSVGLNDAISAALANQSSLSLRTNRTEADFLADGTLKTVGPRYRATIRLTDMWTGEQIKAETFDGEISDAFQAEDELAQRIYTSIRFGIYAHEQAATGPLASAWEEQDKGTLLTKAAPCFSSLQREDWLTARRLASVVLEREPDNSMALAMAALSHLVEANCGWREPTDDDRENGVLLARKAVRANTQSDFAHAVLSWALLVLERDHQGALLAAERSLELTPHYALGQLSLGQAMMFDGRVEQGTAIQLNGIEAIKTTRLFASHVPYLALGLVLQNRFEEALVWCRRADQQVNEVPQILLLMICAAAHAGNMDEADRYAARLLRAHSDFKLSELRIWPLRRSSDWNLFVDGLRKAGLPE
jgi:TolB-like protein